MIVSEILEDLKEFQVGIAVVDVVGSAKMGSGQQRLGYLAGTDWRNSVVDSAQM